MSEFLFRWTTALLLPAESLFRAAAAATVADLFLSLSLSLDALCFSGCSDSDGRVLLWSVLDPMPSRVIHDGRGAGLGVQHLSCHAVGDLWVLIVQFKGGLFQVHDCRHSFALLSTFSTSALDFCKHLVVSSTVHGQRFCFSSSPAGDGFLSRTPLRCVSAGVLETGPVLSAVIPSGPTPQQSDRRGLMMALCEVSRPAAAPDVASGDGGHAMLLVLFESGEVVLCRVMLVGAFSAESVASFALQRAQTPTCVVPHPATGSFFIGTAQSWIYSVVIDVRTLTVLPAVATRLPSAEATGADYAVLDMVVSEDGAFLFAGAADRRCWLFQLVAAGRPSSNFAVVLRRLACLKFHRLAVSAVGIVPAGSLLPIRGSGSTFAEEGTPAPGGRSSKCLSCLSASADTQIALWHLPVSATGSQVHEARVM